jgi:hypothetical protein
MGSNGVKSFLKDLSYFHENAFSQDIISNFTQNIIA